MRREHILVMRFSALGDVAMIVPVVYSVAMKYPSVRITVLSRPFARAFFDHLAPNVDFMSADVKKDYKGLLGLNRLYRRLVAKQFTAVADLHSVLRSDFLRMRFNLGRFNVQHIKKNRRMRRKLIASEKKKELRPLPTPFDNYTDVFCRLGYPIDKIQFHSIFQELPEIPENLGLSKDSSQQWIGVAPFAAHQGKVYPIELMTKVLRQLTEQYPKSRIFLFGRGRQEEEQFSLWIKEMPQCFLVSQYLNSMDEELKLMSHIDVMLSMDSANMHLSSITATPVVSVWGATHPMAGFMGYGQSTDNVVQLDLPCRPCSIYGQKSCKYGDYHCLYNITPETIVNKITKVLTKNN